MARTHVGEECVQGMQEQTGESEAIVAPLKMLQDFSHESPIPSTLDDLYFPLCLFNLTFLKESIF